MQAEPITFTEGELSLDATEGLALVMAHLREQVADSRCYQAIVADPTAVWTDIKTLIEGEDLSSLDRDDTLDAIRLYCVKDEGATLAFPDCLINHENRWVDQFLGHTNFEAQGSAIIAFALPVPEALKDTQNLWFIDQLNKISRIRQEIKAQSFTPGRITPHRLQIGRMGRLDPQEENGQDGFLCELLFDIRGLLEED